MRKYGWGDSIIPFDGNVPNSYTAFIGTSKYDEGTYSYLQRLLHPRVLGYVRGRLILLIEDLVLNIHSSVIQKSFMWVAQKIFHHVTRFIRSGQPSTNTGRS